MGEIVVFQPFDETIVLSGEADHKSKILFNQMIDAARLLIAAKSEIDVDQLNDELVGLQRQFAEATARFEFITDVLDRAHKDRSKLWELLPEGETVPLIRSNDNNTCFAVILTNRRVATVSCLDFELLEKIDNDYRPFFHPRSASG